MRVRDWFEVGARLIGLWMILDCVSEVRVLVTIRLGFYTPPITPIPVYVLHAFTSLAVGCYLMIWGNQLTQFIFGQEERGFDAILKADRLKSDMPQE
jgi:hypothetical protein